MKRFALLFVLIFLLTACAPSEETVEQLTPPPALTPTDDAALLPTLFPNADRNAELTRVDEQGAIVFEITPLNLGISADTLEFDVAMNTHSVDLSMDLSALATLSTDTGLIVRAEKWDAVPGGHHVQGTLIFPSSQDGKAILEGARKLTLTIVNADADSRIFEWELK